MEREKTGTVDLKDLAPNVVSRGPTTKVNGMKFRIGKTLTEFWFEVDGKEYCSHIEETDQATLDSIKARIYSRAELSGHKEITGGR